MSMNTDDNLETYCLVWLDTLIDELSEENLIIIRQLRAIVNYVKVFSDVDTCQKYIESVSNHDLLILIINNKVAQDFVPRIHQFRHVTSIYIYLHEGNDTMALSLSKKVKSVNTTLLKVMNKLESDYRIWNKRRHQEVNDFISISVFNTSITADQSSTELDGQFIYLQLLTDVLLRMISKDTDIDEFFALCEKEYNDNIVNLNTLREFKQNYSPEQALLWYTKESFIYRLLNKALRTQNIDLLYLFRFFIRDIYSQLQRHKCTSPIRVYRGQLLPVEELCILQNSVGQLISMNSFLSTSVSRKLALFYLGEPIISHTSARILFEIDADPQLDDVKPFANITTESLFPTEEEVLMMLGSTFRLESVTEQNDDSDGVVYIVRMVLCSDNNHRSKLIYKTIKEQICLPHKEQTYLLEFGKLLLAMGRFKEAEKYLHRLLDQLPINHPDRVHIYHELGVAVAGKGEYDMSLQWLYRALEIRMQTLPENHEDIANNHLRLGISYEEKFDYKSSLESYNKALAIWEQIDGVNHLRVAWCFNNIGIVYHKTKLYDESLQCHQKSLSIFEKILPVGHPYAAATLHNIGDVYCSLGQRTVAMEYHEKALSYFQKSLPNHHPNIAYTLGSIGLLYENAAKLHQSLCYYQKSMDIYQKIASVIHPGRVRTEKGLLRVTENIATNNMAAQ